MFVPAMFANFIYFIKEREAIRERKEAGQPRPWTNDSILNEWRFCNVNRNHDRETRWIHANIVSAHADSDQLWFNLAIARFINWSPTLDLLGYFEEWEPARFNKVMFELWRSDVKAYTGAYMIRAGTGEDSKMPKYQYLVKRVFGPLWDLRDETPVKGSTCEAWSQFFSRVFGMGEFMRNQIITDMKYTHHLSRYDTEDWYDFVLAGPGTQRGLSRLTGEHITRQRSQDKALDLTVALRKDVLTRLPVQVGRYFDDLNNLTNCLCEWDKYQRVALAQGEPRSKYRPSPDPLA